VAYGDIFDEIAVSAARRSAIVPDFIDLSI